MPDFAAEFVLVLMIIDHMHALIVHTHRLVYLKPTVMVGSMAILLVLHAQSASCSVSISLVRAYIDTHYLLVANQKQSFAHTTIVMMF